MARVSRLARIGIALALASGTAWVSPPAHAAASTLAPIPGSMASLGDSITRGFDSCGWWQDCPSRSWATGDDTSVNSQYLRIRAKNPAISGHAYNDAKTGAKASDLSGQAQAAASQHVGYVTILMGANDACTSSESTMTPVATFSAQVSSALSVLAAGLPDAYIDLVSIPDIKRLWYVGKGNLAARTVWSAAGICQSMLANPTSTSAADNARRDRVRQRVIDFNAVLAQACAQYPRCRFDGNAVFSYQFTLSQVSGWDYFHPNTAGQAVVADVTYRTGYAW
jgi:lysophospholipase L1-like esterase